LFGLRLAVQVFEEVGIDFLDLEHARSTLAMHGKGTARCGWGMRRRAGGGIPQAAVLEDLANDFALSRFDGQVKRGRSVMALS